jgi:hypothetical protein
MHMTPDHRWKPALAALLLAACCSAGTAAPLVKKMFGATASKQEKAAPAAELSIAERRAEVEKALVAARQAVERERSGQYPLPAGATPSQVAEFGYCWDASPRVCRHLICCRARGARVAGKRPTMSRGLKDWRNPARIR